MQQPFYLFKVVLPNEQTFDITEFIEGFSYEDCIEKDDMVRLTIKTTEPAVIDADWFKTGAELRYKFGYLQGLQSAERRLIISNLQADFAEIISLEIEALDKGTVMKKTTSSKIWKRQTASQIAETIAKYYQLGTRIEATEVVYESLPQGNRSDFELLQFLASQEKNGSFQFYIKDNVLHFQKKDFQQKAQRLFTYKQGDGKVLRIRAEYRESTQSREALQTTALSFNPLDQKLSEVNANPFNVKENEKLGTSINTFLEYDANAQKLNTRAVANVKQQSKAEASKTVSGTFLQVSPNLPAPRMENVASAGHKQNKQKELVLTLTIEGDPTIEAGILITVENISKKFSGNYYASKVTHRLNSANYITAIELQRDAPSKALSVNSVGLRAGAGGNQSVQVNQTKGQAQSTAQKKINSYDANSNLIKNGK